MGMFDRVDRPEIICPNCQEGIIDDWQTKSGYCRGYKLTEEDLIRDAKRDGIDEPYYYGFCPECGTEVDFEFHPGYWEQSFETRGARHERYKKESEQWAKIREEYNKKSLENLL